MGDHTAREYCSMTPGSVRTPAVSFAGQLESGELLTGTPTVTEESTAYLAISNKSVNDAALTINDRSVSIGQAVQFKVQKGDGVTDAQMISGSPYTIRIKCGTDAEPAQTLEGFVVVYVEDA